MQQPHYNKDLDVRQIGPEDLPHARLVAGRAFMEHAEDWYGDDETALAGFDGEGDFGVRLGLSARIAVVGRGTDSGWGHWWSGY